MMTYRNKELSVLWLMLLATARCGGSYRLSAAACYCYFLALKAGRLYLQSPHVLHFSPLVK
jgi:hypothetical protein